MAFSGRIYFYSLLLILFTFVACHHKQQKEITEAAFKERMIDVNKTMVGNEAKEIEMFLSGKSWKMKSTGTGLRFEIYKDGAGEKPESGSLVVVSYKVSLLDGTICSPENEINQRSFVLGQNAEAHGLEEGILLMHEGDQARLVFPSHLGFGMQGDGNKIPGLSPLYYDVTLIKAAVSQ